MNPDTELNAVHELFMAWQKAFEAKDINRICSFLTDDIVIPDGDILRDKKWFGEFWAKGFSEGAALKTYLPDKVEFSASGDLAYEINRYDYTFVAKGEAKTSKNYNLGVLKKQKDGSWKFIAMR